MSVLSDITHQNHTHQDVEGYNYGIAIAPRSIFEHIPVSNANTNYGKDK